MKKKSEQKKQKPSAQTSSLRDLPAGKNPKGGGGGIHIGPSGPGG